MRLFLCLYLVFISTFIFIITQNLKLKYQNKIGRFNLYNLLIYIK
jgi:hypothetical protein